MKKQSVGMQFLAEDTSGKLVAVLQVRPKWNQEKNTPESYPGACQVTVHGKLEEGEDFLQALLREVGEELGEEIVPVVKDLRENKKLIELVNLEDPEKHIITYGGIVEKAVLNKSTSREKSREFGGFKLIQQNEIEKIVDVQTFDKNTGVTDENTIAMFPDEKEAVKIAFEKLV